MPWSRCWRKSHRQLSHETQQSLEKDGYRALLFTDQVRLQSRRGSLIQARFPELVRAAAELPDGLVLDGELVVWAGERMSFEALQRRAAAGRRSAARLAEELPAHLIVFDVLQLDGEELLHAAYAERRARLEQLFADHDLRAPWTLPRDGRPGDGAGMAHVLDRGPRSGRARHPRH
ncbi:hypothetical protein [Streptomyces sp. NPDC014006]|uniref:ATP-dependent DNA ligase n=1 Tax=Streptomyces sp. NPDC014006 TaxID=3364870 RepID=UPI0036FF2ACC